MNDFLNSLIDKSVQCWSCGVFDRLFRVISAAAAALYENMTVIAILIFCAFLAFYILYAVIKNLFGEVKDYIYQTSIKPVIINSVIVLSILSLGVYFPRLITTMTMEPVADITLIYTRAMLNTTPEAVYEKVPYQPEYMPDDGFYRPQLRDTVIDLMRTSITQFQAMVKLGLAIMDGAFSWGAMISIGSLVKHAVMFFMGLMLAFGFFKLFIKFCFYFVDVIVNLTLFAFFFPISLVFFIFKESSAANWVKELGKNMAPKMLKNAINSIVTLAAVVITYIVIMVLIARFFSSQETGGAELVRQIISGEIYSGNLSGDNLAAMTLGGIIILYYVVQFLADKIPEIAKKVTDAFGMEQPKAELGDTMGEGALTFAKDTWNSAKSAGKAISGGSGGTP
ncbi:MAG: hypothetical protein LBK26_04745 [Rickettsiales bacterium]|jgi:hypothetical protein|nr:hypothetical protein [Rickettsiales bacterium]